ncbi:metal transporter CNNM4 [Ceratitis capitata]|uniref:Metal transporter CNNM2 n=1 Tax=Ceratitis capitata TaxID=7213 RepID=W8B844_CERCA|nr:metal transporter CNNM4 [Ceratitis capitata]
MQLEGKQSYKSQIRTRNKHLLKENTSNGTYTTRYSCLSSLISTLTALQLLQGSSKPLFEKSGKSMLQSQCNYRTPYIPRENSKYRNLPIVVVFLIVFFECICVGSCAEIKNKSELLSGVIESSIGVIVPRDIENVPKENKGNTTSDWIKSDSAISKNRVERATTGEDLKIFGFRVESSNNEIEYHDGGVPSVLKDSEFTIRIFGKGITQDTVITFTAISNTFGGKCQIPATLLYKPIEGSASNESAVYRMSLPKLDKAMTNGSETFYLCAKNDPQMDVGSATDTKPMVHQGSDEYLQMKTYENLLPLWLSIVIILVCLGFSSLFSGLNLGLMSLDRTELKILCNTGSARERQYARIIQPVREKGNFLLCSILLGNVLVNSTFTILLDGLTSGLFAVIVSTLSIVIFGEITPQAVCSRHGLAIGAKTIGITKVVMVLTFPMSYPISKMLDWALGEEIGNVYNRERLKELVKVTTGTNDLDKNEVNIISGALELRKKTVSDVMTHIDDAFMLSLDALLDFSTVSEIMKSGYSRIPVYDGDKKNIVTLLYIKDLAFVDTDDNTPLRTLCEFYQNPVHFVFEDMTLDLMFNQFKDGTIGHIAFVHRVNNEGDGDPFYETIGLVTLEDVIEELIQAEIVDETDVYIDNRTKVRRNRSKKQDFSAFAERRENQKIRISPQLTLATFQYLSTSVDAFKKEVVSETILRRLLNQDIIHAIKCKGKSKDDPRLFIYQQGKAVDFFVLILEGRVEVTVGKESLLFESGAFTYFGTAALQPNVVVDSPSQQMRGSIQSLNMDAKIRQTFIPDYSVRAVSDVVYIAIKRSLYLTAKKATLLEKTRKSGIELNSEITDDEVERLLHSVNEDEIRAHANHNKTVITGSNTASPSLNDISLQSHSNAPPVHNLHSSSSGEVLDVGSLSSQVTSDPVNDQSEHNGERENVATTPLLPKPSDTANNK